MNKALCYFLALGFIGAAEAAPITFKCTTADGVPASDLVIDIEKKTMDWGGSVKYAIHAIDERYISAYEINHGEAGGEVWVFNRATGEYLRASVYLGWDDAEAFNNQEPGELVARTFGGKCSKPLL